MARTDAQRAADSAALAAAWEYVNDDRLKGQDVHAAMRNKAVEYGQANKVAGLTTTVQSNSSNQQSGDVVLGYWTSSSPDQVNTSNPNDYNAVKVHVRRNNQRNNELGLLFGRVFGVNSVEVSARATAVFQDRIRGFKSTPEKGNSSLLPFAVDINDWNNLLAGNGPDDWSHTGNENVAPGGDNILELNMFAGSNGGGGGGGGGNGKGKGKGGGGGQGQNQVAPGNWGSVDLGPSNGTSALRTIIENGPSPSDMAMFPNGEVALNPSTGTLDVGGNPGISAGMQSAIQSVVGQPRTILLYDQVTGNGNNASFRIVGFAGIRVMDVSLTGSNKYIRIQPSYVADPTAISGGSNGQSYFVGQPVQLVR